MDKNIILCLSIILGITSHNCGSVNTGKQVSIQKQDSMESIKHDFIIKLRKLASTPYASLKDKGAEIDKNVHYENLKNLSVITHPDYEALFIYYDSNDKFKILYTSDEELLESITLTSIIETFGQPVEILDSRAGKHANHYIYPKNGFAFSEINDTIVFFEYFDPMATNEYKKTIYIQPLYR